MCVFKYFDYSLKKSLQYCTVLVKKKLLRQGKSHLNLKTIEIHSVHTDFAPPWPPVASRIIITDSSTAPDAN